MDKLECPKCHEEAPRQDVEGFTFLINRTYVCPNRHLIITDLDGNVQRIRQIRNIVVRKGGKNRGRVVVVIHYGTGIGDLKLPPQPCNKCQELFSPESKYNRTCPICTKANATVRTMEVTKEKR